VHLAKRKWRTFGEKYMGKKFYIMKSVLDKGPVPAKP
jgi:hypothetical protein